MQMDDMILVSIDDHSIEPPDMYDEPCAGQVEGPCPQGDPQRRRHRRVGVPRQEYDDSFRYGGHRRLAKEEWGFEPGALSELRPGCFDVHERVRDMDANGVLLPCVFPRWPGSMRGPSLKAPTRRSRS